MRAHIVFSLCLTLAGAACTARSDERAFTLQGQVLSLDSPTKLRVKHEAVKGLMPAMTMPYEVRDAKLLEGLAPGDLIDATLVVESNAAYLAAITKVGSAPLDQPPAEPTPPASSGFELLKPGDAVPDGRFVDQEGRPLDFKSFAGHPVVVTFMYTKCPMPTFCPFLDRNFAAIQRSLQSDPALSALKDTVRLVSVSFDPATDTPPVLKQHALSVGADAQIWTFLTGERGEIDRFASRFGVQVTRSATDPLDITHNLRTSIVDAGGRLVKTYTGNEWSPAQLLADLKPIAGAH